MAKVSDPGAQRRIETLEKQLIELRQIVSAHTKSIHKVLPDEAKEEEEEDLPDAADEDRPKFDHVTGKPLNAKAVAMRDDQYDEQPRFDVKTGEPKNHAGKIAVDTALITQVVHDMTHLDYHAERFIANSLCLFGREHFLRVYCLRMAHWKMFDKYSWDFK